jgi:putative ABC transport system permease protein
MLQDLRFAVRRLLKAPGFTISAVIVLTLGIGVNAAVFNLVHNLLFAPPAFSNPSELVQVFSQDRTNPKSYRGFSYPAYRNIREQDNIFNDVTGFNMAIVGLGQRGDTRRAFASLVCSNYFSVLGISLEQGRTFLPEEEIPGRNTPVAIVSYGYWQKHNLDPAVLGSELLIDGRPFTIVGITPRGFTGTMQVFSVEVWLPLSVYDQLANDFEQDNKKRFGDPAGRQLMLIGRLKPSINAIAAKAELDALAGNLERAFPVEQKDQIFTTTPVPRFSVSTSPSSESDIAGIGPLLLGMSVAVLLVACLNLANMLLASSMARRKEIAIRLAVGGSRKRIVRQLLTEGFLLALAGGAGGLILGLWSTDLLVASLRSLFPLDVVWYSRPNIPILLATLGFCTAATVTFALGPALKLSRSVVAADLKELSAEDTAKRRWKFFRGNPLVAVQMAFSLALLTAAALFIHGASRAASVDTGLRPGASFLLETDAGLAGYEPERAQDLYQRLDDRLAALPGVENVAITATVPFGMISLGRSIQRAGVHSTPGTKPATAAEGLAFGAAWNSVGASYFETVGLPIHRGRAFTEAETSGAAGSSVAIIDEALAAKLWPGGDALGQFIQYANPNAPQADSSDDSVGISGDLSGDSKDGQVMQIVGIAPTTRQALFDKDPRGQIYVPFARGFQSNISYFVRFHSLARGSEAATAGLLRDTMRDVDPALPVLSLRTFDQHLDGNIQLWIVRAGAAMFSVFGGLALGLAVVGLYGTKAYSVARRTREIGIRMALGAEHGTVLNMFMREALVTIAGGIGLGLILAAGTAKILSGMLYDVAPLDPFAFTAAPLALAAAAFVATWLPARRATRISPTRALRME